MRPADGSISDAALLKERHEVVGDVALGDTTQVELGLGVGEGDGGTVDRDGAIVDMGQCRLDVLICGLDLVVKIPEARDGADGDVKEPVGLLGVADGCSMTSAVSCATSTGLPPALLMFQISEPSTVRENLFSK